MLCVCALVLLLHNCVVANEVHVVKQNVYIKTFSGAAPVRSMLEKHIVNERAKNRTLFDWPDDFNDNRTRAYLEPFLQEGYTRVHMNDTVIPNLDEWVSGLHTQHLSVFSTYKVAIFTVDFDQPAYIEKNGVRCRLDGQQIDGVESKSCRNMAYGYGATRLICGHQLFESVPSTVSDNHPPLYFIPWTELHVIPLLSVLEPIIFMDVKPAPNRFMGVLVLDYTETTHDVVRTVHNLQEHEVEGCQLRFLHESSQSVDWGGRMVNLYGSEYFGTVSMRSPSGDEIGGSIVDDGHSMFELATGMDIPCSMCSPKLDGRIVSDVVGGTVDHTSASYLYGDALKILQHLNDSAALYPSFVQQGAKFSGIISGLVRGFVEPVCETMGQVVGDWVMDMVLRPVVVLTIDEIVEEMASGIQPPLTFYLVNNIVPTLTETITDTEIETLSRFLCTYVSEHATPMITERVTTGLTKTLVPKLVMAISSEGVVKMARQLIHTSAQMLGKSIPHALVSTLTHVLSHQPLSDYYCWYCFYKNTWCQYCSGAISPIQYYWNMFYTGWYSSYYTIYYTDVRDLNVKAVRQKEENFEDPEDFGVRE